MMTSQDTRLNQLRQELRSANKRIEELEAEKDSYKVGAISLTEALIDYDGKSPK